MRRQRLRRQAAPRPGPETDSFFVSGPGGKSRLRRPIRLMGTWCRQAANDPNVADTRLARFAAPGQIAVGRREGQVLRLQSPHRRPTLRPRMARGGAMPGWRVLIGMVISVLGQAAMA